MFWHLYVHLSLCVSLCVCLSVCLGGRSLNSGILWRLVCPEFYLQPWLSNFIPLRASLIYPVISHSIHSLFRTALLDFQIFVDFFKLPVAIGFSFHSIVIGEHRWYNFVTFNLIKTNFNLIHGAPWTTSHVSMRRTCIALLHGVIWRCLLGLVGFIV